MIGAYGSHIIADSLSGGVIRVVVGSDPLVTLHVHENVICASSDFFKAAMRSEWKESKERSIEFKDDDPETFEIYLHWLYCGTVPTRDDEEEPTSDVEYLQLGKAYVLGDKLQDGTFKDVIIDVMMNKRGSRASDGGQYFPGEQVVRYIYDNTPKSSKARDLLVDFYVSYGNELWLKGSESEELPKDFLMDLAVAFFERKETRATTEPTIVSITYKYSEHVSPCYLDFDPAIAMETPMATSGEQQA
ncbi:hypothetical protein MMC31_006561 [Peltigera leucophlebia]|nr:hypothetical protein [Peltigera leucophlebia]